MHWGVVARDLPAYSVLQAQVPSARHQLLPNLKACSAVEEQQTLRHLLEHHLCNLPSVPVHPPRMKTREGSRSVLQLRRLLRRQRLLGRLRLLVEVSSSTSVLLRQLLLQRLVGHRRRRRSRLEGLRSLLGMERHQARGSVSGRSDIILRDPHSGRKACFTRRQGNRGRSRMPGMRERSGRRPSNKIITVIS